MRNSQSSSRPSQGDATAFEETRLPLEDCLQAQFEKKSKGLPLAFWIVLSLLLLGLGIWVYQARSDQQRWAQLLERVGQEPGLVVTSVQEEGPPTIFYGLRDPLAANPRGDSFGFWLFLGTSDISFGTLYGPHA